MPHKEELRKDLVLMERVRQINHEQLREMTVKAAAKKAARPNSKANAKKH